MDDARIRAAREKAGRAAAQRAGGRQLTPGEAAFDHPATRAAWTKARRRVRRSLTLWSVLWAALFVGVSMLGELDLSPKAEHNLVGGLGALLFLSYLCILYLRLGSLSCLRRIRHILRREPWRPIAAARRRAGVTDSVGVPVEVDLVARDEGNERADGSPARKAKRPPKILSARNPVHRRRWHEAMERGALLAGGRSLGVLALPDGTELMEVRQRGNG
ncbi:hypothetical protein [Streptomyces sp. NPDC101150]|uniref:hypothetical protein n=1 Tax=Streptomyces sp. NPDC101150 TaxID=3366114 RepID=UPI003811CEAB